MAVHCNNRLRRRTAMVLPAGCPHSVGVNSGGLQAKSKSPRCSPGLGSVITND